MVICMPNILKIIPKLIIIPRREIVRMGQRWIVYLPMDYSELWEELKRQGKKVRIYIEVVNE